MRSPGAYIEISSARADCGGNATQPKVDSKAGKNLYRLAETKPHGFGQCGNWMTVWLHRPGPRTISCGWFMKFFVRCGFIGPVDSTQPGFQCRRIQEMEVRERSE